MFNGNGTAHADGTPIPKRLGVFFWGLGVRPEHWTPSGEGTIWTPAAETAPLAALNTPEKKVVSIISGLQCPIKGLAHWSGRAQSLTASYDPNKGQFGAPTRPSIDQIAAARWDADEMTRAPHPYLGLGISRHGSGNSTIGGASIIDESGPRRSELGRQEPRTAARQEGPASPRSAPRRNSLAGAHTRHEHRLPDPR